MGIRESNDDTSGKKWFADFAAAEQLPPPVCDSIAQHYSRVADWLASRCSGRGPLLLGINGAQGSGKSTLARFLQRALAQRELRVAVVSLDDFYLSGAARRQLAATVHPLLATRGVPGTHDVAELRRCLAALRAASANSVTSWPTFDKAADEPAPQQQQFHGRADAILLEGWCVGTAPEDAAQLNAPLNDLEATADADGRWRNYVNARLADDYAALFAELDCLCFLRIPDFSVVRRWRGLQETRLVAQRGGGMSGTELEQFIQHFERLTRAALRSLPDHADCLLEFDEQHRCIGSTFKERIGP